MPLLKKTWLTALVCALLGAAVYLPILSAEFVWDDSLVQTLQLPYFKSPKDAFVSPGGLVEWTGNYYRPLVVLSYMAEAVLNDAVHGVPGTDDARVAPIRAAIPHGVTLLFHALATGLFVLLAARLLKGRPGAAWGLWAAGALFALHPVHAETASTIAGRSDSLAALFLFPALLSALHSRDRRSHVALAGAFSLFLLALLSKEAALAGLFLLPLCLWLAPEEEGILKYPKWLPTVAFCAAAAAYAALRLTGNTRLANETLESPVSSLFAAAAFYVRDLFYPLPVSPYLPDLPSPGASAAYWALGLALAAGAVWAWRKGEKLYLLCVLWFAVSILPPLAAAYRHYAETLVAQRYLYLPSAGFCLAFGAAAAWGSTTKWRKHILAAVGVLLAAGAAVSFNASSIWQSDLALWTALTRDPDTSRHSLPWLNLGTIQLQKGDIVNAEENLRRSLITDVLPERESRALALNGLGVIRYDQATKYYRNRQMREAFGLLEESERYLEQAAQMGIPDWTIFKNLAATRLQKFEVGKLLNGRRDLFTLELARQNLVVAVRHAPPGIFELAMLQRLYDTNAREAGVQ